MVTYSSDNKYAYFNNIKFTRDNKTGYFLSTKKLKDDKRQRLHVYVWEYYNGEVPEGYSVHHIDENKNNNEIDNLKLLATLKHIRFHSDTRKEDIEWLSKARKNVKENAMPKAIEWHKSEEGREWHKIHYERTKDAFNKTYYYKCTLCGKEYTTTQINSKFCSNNCKSAWRRNSGIDNEKRICVICGKEFKINKYSKTLTCSLHCRSELKRLKKLK